MADVHLVASSSASSCFRGKPLVPPLHNKLTGCAGPLPYWRAQWNLDHLLYGRSTNRAEVAGSGVVRGGTASTHVPRAPPAVAPVATGHHDVVPQGIAAYHTHLLSSTGGMVTGTSAGAAKGSSVPLAPAEPLRMSIGMKNKSFCD